MKIGFIGTGVMGASMADHLLEAGYEMNVYNRTKEKADDLVSKGALWKDSPAEIAKSSDLIFTILGYPKDVEEVYFGEDGIFEELTSNKIIVDMTTSTPALAEKIAKKAKEIGAQALDAPVSGGDIGAKEGQLTVMMGGEETAFNEVESIMKHFSNELRLFGPAGSGQHTKMANQIMVAGTMTGMIEMFAYAKEAGLDLKEVVKTVSGGAGQNRSLDNYAARIIQGDYSPGFFVKHFIKDLGIVLSEAEAMNLELPATRQAYKLYKLLEDKGHEDDGTQALIKLWWS